MSERIIDVEHVPEGTRCSVCGHVNGDHTSSGTRFIQPFYVIDEHTECERWSHVGCEWQLEADRAEAWSERRDWYDSLPAGAD